MARGSPEFVRALVSALRPARAGLEAALDAEAALQAESFADPELARAARGHRLSEAEARQRARR